VAIAIPVLGAFEPEAWMGIPFINGMRSPVRAYMLLTFAIAILAGLGVGRLGRSPGGSSRARIAVAIPVVAYFVVVGLIRWSPDIFDRLFLFASTFSDPGDMPGLRERGGRHDDAVAGAAELAFERRSCRRRRRRPSAVHTPALTIAVGNAALIAWLGRSSIPPPASEFSYAKTLFIVAARATSRIDPLRLIRRWYTACPTSSQPRACRRCACSAR
jgi:hypothetical protein